MSELEMYEGEEVWQEIVGFPKYMVSSHGRVRHTDRITPRKYNINNSGFPVIALYGDDNNTRYLRQINNLVANAFLPAPKYSDENSVWHLDGNLLNCHVSNLKWETRPRVLEWNRMNREKTPSLRTPQVYDSRKDLTYENAFECAMAEGKLESSIVWLIEGLDDIFDYRAHYSYVKGW